MVSKKKNVISPLFIISAIGSFVLMGFIYMAINLTFDLSGRESGAKSEIADEYNLNLDYSDGDPMITKEPQLKDMLAGPIITAIEPRQGPDSAPITIVIFSDFECGFCYQQEQTLKAIMAKHKGKISLIWKDYPEENPASLSFKAAIAARCAQEQGKFWPFHDFLYDSESLEQDKFMEIADILEMDIEIFADCLDSQDVAKVINDNITEANALGIKGIPYTFINNQAILGQISLGELEKIVDGELND